VRDFFIHNALYWLGEYQMDGLRLDAVHAIRDSSEPDILTELAETVQERLGDRAVHLVLENDGNEARRLERDMRGAPRTFVAQWNDDAHHALHVLVTGERHGYYADYADRPARHLGRCLAEGFAYQGERSGFRDGAPRGQPSAHLSPLAFIAFLQNHDQIGNRALGERISRLAEPEAVRAALAILLLAPSPPLLFMGEEWGCEQPFPFFCNFEPALAARVREGRRGEVARFPAFQSEAARRRIPDPTARETFESAVLRWEDLSVDRHAEWSRYYRDLLALRHGEITPRQAHILPRAGEFREIGRSTLEVRWPLSDGGCLCLLAHLAGEPFGGVPTAPRGRLLFATHGALEGLAERREMPPWSVGWYLEDAAAVELG
jgi:malto-oligosyltrehalose trehalohydrolase